MPNFSVSQYLRDHIRTVPDWPAPGVQFSDITPLLQEAKVFRVLIDALQQHQPPISKGIRPKLRYAHQGGSNPPIVVIHGNHVDGVKDAYTRFLEKTFRRTFQLSGTPLRVQYKQGSNPFAEDEDKRKPGEGIVSMRRRKTAHRAELKAKKAVEDKDRSAKKR